MGDTDWDRDRISIALELTTFKKRTLAVKYADDINISRLAKNENMTTVFSREIQGGVTDTSLLNIYLRFIRSI